MEDVYGFQMKKTSPQQIEERVQAALKASLARVRDATRRKREDLSDDSYDYDPAMDVATAADRKVKEDKTSRMITRSFGCHVCLHEVDATTAAPEKVYVTVEHWHGWSGPFQPPEKWEDIKLHCAACAAPDLEKAAWARKRARESNMERACEQSKRLKEHMESNGHDDNNFMQKLHKLRFAQLKALCSVNAVLKGGKKDQLIERLVGVWRFGTILQCPSCKKTSLELQYTGSTPNAIQCKHMRGQGKPCGFRKKLTPGSTRQVLTEPLRDTAEGDLAKVGIVLES